ncbi:MAG: hypothetical protein QF926_16010, partial [Alphaproteobacteria bacterium]|nr:hypothetical protein [Alphaproteobacteria bacterium]
AAARADGVARLIGRYRPTAKNGLVAELYPKLGFACTGVDGVFERDLRATPQLAFSDHITVIREKSAP